MSQRPRGPIPDWEPSTERQKAILLDVVARFEQHNREGTLPRGPRGIFYDLRPNGLGNGVTYRKPDSKHPISEYGPMEAHPGAVQEVMVLARRAGKIPEHWVADQHAPSPLAPVYDDSAGDAVDTAVRIVKNAAENFALDPQRDQPVHIEILCEAEDLASRAARQAEPYGVSVYPSGGFGGLKGKREFAERAADRDVPTIVLQIGDWDRHGRYITTAAAEDAIAWVPYFATGWVPPFGPGMPGDDWLTFRRIALTGDQAEAHGLLDDDGKAEVDGLPVPVLDAIIRDAIESLQDPAIRQQSFDDEERERAGITAAIRAALNQEEE